MKRLGYMLLLGCCFSLTACETIKEERPQDVTAEQTQTAATITKPIICPKGKNPMTVSIYKSGEHPSHPYKIIGMETISKYNHTGIKKQEANIHDALREIAAKMGGDAIINLQYDKKTVKGTVITFQNSGDKQSAV